jgi:dTDP-glucose pyrophosphorylase
MTDCAVILARGLGTRMRASHGDPAISAVQLEAARQGAKAMMPFARPFLDYSLSHLADAGIREAIIVIGPEHSDVRDYFRRTAVGRRVGIQFAVQEQALGTANAVRAAADTIGPPAFLVLNGDNLYPPSAIRQLRLHDGRGLVAFSADALIRGSGMEAERILKFALLEMNDSQHLVDIHEKPAADHPLAIKPTRHVSMNLWRFTSSIFSAIDRIDISARGEYEIQDAVRLDMRETGAHYRCFRSDDPVIDLSSQRDIEAVSRRLAGMAPRP